MDSLRDLRHVSLACSLALAAGAAGATVTTVYKCFDRNLDVVYTDQPCRGEQLRIEGGTVDHAAVAELQREREAVSRSAAQRIAELRARPDPAPQYVYGGAPPAPGADYLNAGDSYYPFGYGYAPGYGDRGRGRQYDFRNNQRHERFVPVPKGNLIKR